MHGETSGKEKAGNEGAYLSYCLVNLRSTREQNPHLIETPQFDDAIGELPLERFRYALCGHPGVVRCAPTSVADKAQSGISLLDQKPILQIREISSILLKSLEIVFPEIKF